MSVMKEVFFILHQATVNQVEGWGNIQMCDFDIQRKAFYYLMGWVTCWHLKQRIKVFIV